MVTLKIGFDTVAVTDAMRQLPNDVSDKYDINKTAYITKGAIVTCSDIA